MLGSRHVLNILCQNPDSRGRSSRELTLIFYGMFVVCAKLRTTCVLCDVTYVHLHANRDFLLFLFHFDD